MELQQENTQTRFTLDPYTKSSIAATAKIAGVAAVLSITGTVIGAVGLFIKPANIAAAEGFGNNNMAEVAMGSSIFTVLFSLLINGILFFYLYRFSKLAKTALKNDQFLTLESGLQSLGSYFRIVAVLLIVSLGFMVLAGLAVGMGAALK